MSSCKKFIEVPAPVTSTNSANVYATDATAIAALTGIYATMSNSTLIQGGIAAMSLFPGLSADELTLYDYTDQQLYQPYYSNALTSKNTGIADFWNQIYPLIYDANAAIEGLINNNSGMTPKIKQQLLGEAKFIRAFLYFYLVNLYGDIPLALSTDYSINRLLARKPSTQVYQQIIADLKDAQGFLVDGYLAGDLVTPTIERTTPNKWAATALLSRVYLYTQKWDSAVAQANTILNNESLFSLVGLDNVFLKNSHETIWQLQSVASTPTVNSPDAFLFILPPTGPSVNSNPVYLSDHQINSFEPGDQRKTNWTNNITLTVASLPTTYYYAYKYKNISSSDTATEYRMVLRLAEQYLIRAEARAELGDISGAQADLNAIRSRAGLDSTTAIDKTNILTAVLHERQVELFTEWGHRWLDLKRTGNINTVMDTVCHQKHGNWSPNWQWYPIPFQSISTDPNLLQSPGYQ